MTTNTPIPRSASRSPSRSVRSQGQPDETREASSREHCELAFVARLVRREEAAWQRLLTEFRGVMLHGLISGLRELHIPPTSRLLEEMCSEVIVVLFENDCGPLRRFKGNSKFSTWLMVVSRRVCLARAVWLSRGLPTGVSGTTALNLDTLPDSNSADDQATTPELDEWNLESMQTCLPLLAPTDRWILEQIFLQRRSYQEIATQLGITRNAVGPKLTRARERLRRLIARHRQHSTADPPPGDPRSRTP